MSGFTTPDWPKRAEKLRISEQQILEAGAILQQGLVEGRSLESCAYAVMRYYQDTEKTK